METNGVRSCLLPMKKFCSFLFRLVVFFPIGVLFAYLLSLLPVIEYSWLYALFLSACMAFYKPQSIYAWEVILDYYGKEIPGISPRIITAFGNFNDSDVSKNEGFAIFISVTDDGVILYKGHIVPFLRETAVIPWDKIESFKMIDNTLLSKDGLVDQIADMIVELQIENVTTTLEIPWSKEIEMYSNLYKDGLIK